jgi:superfamily I DNA/RNA helicase
MTAAGFARWIAPKFDDDDFRWAATQLGLQPEAFLGNDGRDPRRAALARMDDLDVVACPGSGKTTLLVAKLALLARQWSARAQGICVISHTNVARTEIETRLGPTREGRRVLTYPHFIGTIHSFVNQFLTAPFLRSAGITLRLIDDGFANAKREARLSFSNKLALEKNNLRLCELKARNIDCDLGEIRWGGGVLNRQGNLYQALQEVFRSSMAEGYLRHEEIFLWAERLLDVVPEALNDIRRRFPIVFVDEVQDTSEAQALILNRLFGSGEGPSIRQRFGDMNQAIFGLTEISRRMSANSFLGMATSAI